MSAGIFSENEIVAFATLTFGYLDSDMDISPEFYTALDHLVFMGFVRKNERAKPVTWTLIEVPPMAQDAVAAKAKQIDSEATPI